MKKLPLLVIASTLTGLMACEQKKTTVKTDTEKYSYAIGYQFAKNLKGQNVEIDSGALALAVEDVISNKEARLKEEEMQTAMQKMYESRQEKMKAEGEENKKKGQEFLAQNEKKEGVKVTASGLQYKVLTEGEGDKPSSTDTVVVHYKGTLTDGTQFDSSYDRNEPAEFPVDRVIPGWTEALQLMKKGAKYQLFIPSELAYGERGRPSIPANSVLLFDVELIDIKKPAKEEKAEKPKTKK